jgi:hypothetical protein
MKTLLNVIGALALLAVVPVFLMAQSAVHEIEAAMALVLGCLCVGVGVVVEKMEEGHKLMRDQGKVLVMIAQALNAGAPARAGGPSVPTIPGKERYYVSDGESALGPHEITAIRLLHERGTLNNDTLVLLEGSQEWRKLGEILKT